MKTGRFNAGSYGTAIQLTVFETFQLKLEKESEKSGGCNIKRTTFLLFEN